MTEDKTLVIVAQKDIAVDDPTIDDLHRVGTLAAIKKMDRAEHGYQIIVQGIARVELIEAVETKPFLKARVHPLAEPTGDGTEVEAMARAMLDQAAAVHALLQPDAPFTVEQMFAQVKDPLHQAYLLASMLNLDLAKSQALLETNSRADALRQIHEHLTHELQVLELRRRLPARAIRIKPRAKRVPAPPATTRHPGRVGRAQPRASRRGRIALPLRGSRIARQCSQGSRA